MMHLRKARQEVSNKFQLNEGEVVRVYLSVSDKMDLMKDVYFTGVKQFTDVAKAQSHFLWRNENGIELYSSQSKPPVIPNGKSLSCKEFIKVPIKEKNLLVFLQKLRVLRTVNKNE